MAKQSRKTSQSRRRRRRARRSGVPAVVVLLCVLVAAVAIVTAMTLFFKVQHFTLTGTTRYSVETLQSASGLQVGDNLILFDKFEVIDRLFDACPYLDTVRLRRRYPDTLEFMVTDCVAVAELEDAPGEMPDPEDESRTLRVGGTGRWLVDRQGKLLEQRSGDGTSGLTVVTGVTLLQPEPGQKVNFLQEDTQKPLFLLLNTAEDDGILQDIGEMDASQPYDIRFTFRERFQVKLGSTADLEKKLRCLLDITENKLGSGVRGTVDVSDIADTQTARFLPMNQ